MKFLQYLIAWSTVLPINKEGCIGVLHLRNFLPLYTASSTMSLITARSETLTDGFPLELR